MDENAAWAAIVGALAAIGTLFLDTPISKLLRATSSQALPASSPQKKSTVAPAKQPPARKPPTPPSPAAPTVSATVEK